MILKIFDPHFGPDIDNDIDMVLAGWLRFFFPTMHNSKKRKCETYGETDEAFFQAAFGCCSLSLPVLAFFQALSDQLINPELQSHCILGDERFTQFDSSGAM